MSPTPDSRSRADAFASPGGRLHAWHSHQAAWLAVRAAVLVLLVAQATRVLLVAIGADAWPASPAPWLAAFGQGLLADALAAAAAGAGLLALGALTHGRRPRSPGRQAKRAAGLALLVFALLFVAVAEGLFWQEFTTRFSFIAVDYLLYTTEVIGNIRESYPIGAILTAIALAAAGVAAALLRATPVRAGTPWRWRTRVPVALLSATLAAFAARAGLALHDRAETAPALRAHAAMQELARNGPLAFVAALRDNALSFARYYATVEPEAVDALAGAWPRPAAGGLRRVSADDAGRRAGRPRHVVIVQVESLSAEYLGAFGNPRGLTPNLDRIAREGVLFTGVHAIGTRTVRGLEALSAALPPLPGQSIVRRPGNQGLVTLGGVLARHGFAPQFLYGGYGLFDNMNAWFAGSGYRVRDRTDLPDDPRRFANVWGVADEYLFDEAIATLDREAGGPQRVLLHLMTTSNHRPYTYPDGRIDIASKTGRDGAVKYTDWAIGHFIEQARTRPWFDDTLFVIVADHCASVAGRTRLPPDRYRIPAIFYAPAHLAPRTVGHLASQIDLVPTMLAWLGIDDGGRFVGQDLLGEQVEQRAFLGNYQEIGLLVPAGPGTQSLVVLAPRRRVSQFEIDAAGAARAVPLERDLARAAIARFQQADRLLLDGSYRLPPASAPGVERLTMHRGSGPGAVQ